MQIYQTESAIIASTELYIYTDDVGLDSKTTVWFTIAFLDGGDYGRFHKVEISTVGQSGQLRQPGMYSNWFGTGGDAI